MFKRIIAILMCLAMVFSFVACGGDKEDTYKGDESTNDSSAEISVGDVEAGIVPDVIGKTYEEAEAYFKAAGIRYRLNGENHSTVAEGIVFDTDYTAGEQVDKNTYVIITYSLGISESEKALEPAVDKFVADRTELEQGANKDYVPLNYDVMKCVWISQYDLDAVFRKDGKQTDKETFTEYIGKIMDNAKSTGLNTVIVQTRPNADSFCVSEYYPWSEFVSGTTGRSPDYDPYQIMIDEAHKRGLSFQAWINPMRGMTESQTRIINITYPIRQWIEDSTKNKTYIVNLNGRWYLNPAYEEVRQLIINGAAEICRYYNVDGVHMDDYFYPAEATSAFDDKAFLEQKNTGFSARRDFRYNNLNLLVKGIYDAVKAENPNLIFGISPAGVYKNVMQNQYADVKTWLSKSGYIDYIMPQLYWGLEHDTCGFKQLYEQWANLIKVDTVKLAIGMSLGKAVEGADDKPDDDAGSGKYEWVENKDVFKRMYEFLIEQDDCIGFSIFSYNSMFNVTSGAQNSKTAEEQKNFVPIIQTWESNKIEY